MKQNANIFTFHIQPNQLNMAVLFWYFVKSDATVRYCTLAYTDQVTVCKVPETNSHLCITEPKFFEKDNIQVSVNL